MWKMDVATVPNIPAVTNNEWMKQWINESMKKVGCDPVTWFLYIVYYPYRCHPMWHGNSWVTSYINLTSHDRGYILNNIWIKIKLLWYTESNMTANPEASVISKKSLTIYAHKSTCMMILVMKYLPAWYYSKQVSMYKHLIFINKPPV